MPAKTSLIALLAFAAPLTAQTAAHPNFSGTWVLDASKTLVSGQMPAPATATYLVVQRGDSISADMTQGSEMGEMTVKKVYGVDGKEWQNSLDYQGTAMTLSSVLKWTGTVLSIHTNSNFQGTPVEQNETWTLGEGGKTFSQRVTTMVNGEEWAATTLVFNKK